MNPRKLPVTDKVYYNLAKKNKQKCLEVESYYKRCLRIAKATQKPFNDYQQMLSIITNLKKTL